MLSSPRIIKNTTGFFFLINKKVNTILCSKDAWLREHNSWQRKDRVFYKTAFRIFPHLVKYIKYDQCKWQTQRQLGRLNNKISLQTTKWLGQLTCNSYITEKVHWFFKWTSQTCTQSQKGRLPFKADFFLCHQFKQKSQVKWMVAICFHCSFQAKKSIYLLTRRQRLLLPITVCR